VIWLVIVGSVSLILRINASLFSVTAEAFKTENTVNQGKKRIVFAQTHICSGMDVGSALAIENIAGFYELAVRALRAEALGLRIAAVLCGADTLFMSKKLKVKL
jgi:hypothetical protein